MPTYLTHTLIRRAKHVWKLFLVSVCMLLLGLNSTAFALCSACQLQLSIMQVNYYFILLDFNNTMAEKAALETQIASNIRQSLDWGAEQLQTEDQDARNVLQEMIDCIDSQTVQLMIQSAALDGTLLGMNSDMQLIQNDINAFPDRKSVV